VVSGIAETKKITTPGVRMEKKFPAFSADSEEFWSDDAVAEAERERVAATGFRMPQAATPKAVSASHPSQSHSRRAAKPRLNRSILVAFGVVLALSAVGWFVVSRPVVTLAEFDQLTDGMSIEQANRIVGKEGATVMDWTFPNLEPKQRRMNWVCIQWENTDGSNAVAGFDSGLLSVKVQIGLK
jgi:small neutral amino acid transporter SnatA (MarC family)